MDERINININYINPFLVGASLVFNQLLNVDIRRGKAKVTSVPNPINDVIIMVEIEGNATGYVLYSFSFFTITKIAEALMPGLSEEQIMDEYKDIVGELANMITGNAMNLLSKSGLDISTPVVMHRNDLVARSPGQFTVLVLTQYSPYGQLEITIVLKSNV
ncbi:MAG: chemotaxis protein CheX [Spirochaetota bacterium]|nr:chemotaxis protein CheX [Spirochaetota bacterium]